MRGARGLPLVNHNLFTFNSYSRVYSFLNYNYIPRHSLSLSVCILVMLPTYNPSFRRPKYRSLSQQTPVGSLRDRLLSRSRATNLAVLIFSLILGISLISNLRYLFLLSRVKSTQGFVDTPQLIADTISYNYSLSHLDHLIIVAGHAIWKGGAPANHKEDSEWVLDVAQTSRGNPEAFYAHIAKG